MANTKFILIYFQFYVLEGNLELYARDMLFLMLVYENPKRMGLQGNIENIIHRLYSKIIYAFKLKVNFWCPILQQYFDTVTLDLSTKGRFFILSFSCTLYSQI